MLLKGMAAAAAAAAQAGLQTVTYQTVLGKQADEAERKHLEIHDNLTWLHHLGIDWWPRSAELCELT